MKTHTEAVTTVNQALHRVGHCLYRSAKTRIYYAIVKRGGKQIKRSLKTTDAALAKRRLADLEEKAGRLNSSDGAKIGFKDLGQRWLQAMGTGLKPSSYLRQEVVTHSLNRYFGEMMVRAISRGNVETWAGARSKLVAARTFNHERATLTRIFVYAMRDGIVLDNPATVVKRIKPPRDRVVIPTKEQFKTMIEAIRSLRFAEDGANLCELLAYSGCRLGEATAITWGDVSFEGKQFTVTGGETGTKNHEVRTVPLFPALEEFLLGLRASLPRPPEATDRIARIDGARGAMTSACRNAGLPNFTHHHLRHFFCSNAIEAGVDFKAIAGWLGHKDGGLLVAKTYGHLRDEHSAAMAKRMTFSATGDKQ